MGSLRRAHVRGFTLLELLVVIAIVVAAPGGGPRGRGVPAHECPGNRLSLEPAPDLRRLSGYSRDHYGRFVSPRTSPVGVLPNDKLWVRSFDEVGHDRLDPAGFERLDALMDGALWPYIGSAGVYRSPLDPTPRIRSYSLSGFISDLPDVPPTRNTTGRRSPIG